ncbi:hypothetical protein [Candidatus Atelocyanobacterium thalassae]|uniref:DUF1190 domain-containing protein n=1 Tax=cyanobacterium endosymbiont of Braarudosphaera bigelowii TaxID=1285375 RepID=A0ABM7U4C8_9CHRO|nr:hypothetical protein [Candidatus Atelocyanobacterium thalassa]BDA39556.1 hypothetical protein CPARK_000039500 [cyanobacterium endosymbiont of Braarudosphaera bigelowii]
MRKIIIIFLSFTLCLTTISCGSSTLNESLPNNKIKTSISNQVKNGSYPIQQAEYNDINGTYTLTLLNTPPGKSSTYSTDNLQMARLTPEQIANGKSNYLEITTDAVVMYIKEDFKIEYIHNVTEPQTNDQVGTTQNIVRRESSFWSPFAGAMAGQALGSILFSPRYYVPPLYHSGQVMNGYGSYGSNYNQAVQRYQEKYNSSPPAVKNRQTFRTTRNLQKSTSNIRNSRRGASRSSGSGFGSSNLRKGSSSRPSVRSRSSFGSRNSFRSRPSTRSFRRRR